MLLAKDAIFPIVKDKSGNPLPHMPASGFLFPGTIQGEGKLTGIPSLFIRLAGCNLRCAWRGSTAIIPCDTAYAAYDITETIQMSVEDIVETVMQNLNNIRHIVITGGEPFLQAREVAELSRQLKERKALHITVETNATIYDEECARYIDLFSLSPKLTTSIYREKPNSQRINITAIQSFIDYAHYVGSDFQLKFVYSDDSDIIEIKDILSRLSGWDNDDILLMPMGADSQQLHNNSLSALQYAIRNGWRYCDRLHISIFGNKDGV